MMAATITKLSRLSLPVALLAFGLISSGCETMPQSAPMSGDFVVALDENAGWGEHIHAYQPPAAAPLDAEAAAALAKIPEGTSMPRAELNENLGWESHLYGTERTEDAVEVVPISSRDANPARSTMPRASLDEMEGWDEILYGTE